MPKLPKKAIRYGRTYERTDPNYRKASLLKIQNQKSFVGGKNLIMWCGILLETCVTNYTLLHTGYNKITLTHTQINTHSYQGYKGIRQWSMLIPKITPFVTYH